MKQRRGSTPRSQPLPFEAIHQPFLPELLGRIEVFQRTDWTEWDIVARKNYDLSTVVIEVLKLSTEMSHCFGDTKRAFTIRSCMSTTRVHGVIFFYCHTDSQKFHNIVFIITSYWIMAASDTALRDTCQRDVPTSLLQTAKATDKETLRRDSHIHLFRSRWALWHGPGPLGKKLPVTCVVSKSCEVCLVGSKQNFRRMWSISSTDSDIPVFWILLRICYVWWSAWCFFGEVFCIKATDRPVTGSHRCVLCALHLNQDVLCCDMVRQVPSSIRRCHNDNQLETQTYVVFCAHPIILQHVTIKQRMPSAVEQPN